MIAKKLGAEIRKRRKELGLTQQQLGDKVGVAKFHVSLWETGRVTISEAYAVKVLKALGVDDVEILLNTSE